MDLPPLTASIRGPAEEVLRGARRGEHGYDPHPIHPVEGGELAAGYRALAAALGQSSRVCLDGFVGVDWSGLRAGLEGALRALGVEPRWIDVGGALRSNQQVDELIAPSLGGDDPLFGKRFEGSLIDFFDPQALRALKPFEGGPLTIVYGPGAALVELGQATLVYVDLAKSELQGRSRRGEVRNLGADRGAPPAEQYKRFYFVDWPALGAHKAALARRVDLFVDDQLPGRPALLDGDAVRRTLARLAREGFRVRPWFEPGPWGGQWMRRRMPALPEAPNFAWSFELIAPENGLLLGDGERVLELSFEWLMYLHRDEVLGEFGRDFGFEFPIRFDYLDTVQGGNLSLQCHPGREFIGAHFGETMPQDETYYILDCQPDSRVYLGFAEGVEPERFRAELERSRAEGREVDVERYVQTHPAARHDLFLIPSGTIHCSGAGIQVLEISATPYIFTFKLYDWLRVDLSGNPRHLNIERGFANLRFDRSGPAVQRELLSRPRVLHAEPGYRRLHLPTHADHFYDVHRLELEQGVELETEGSPQILMVVEGLAADVRTAGGSARRYHYAETFAVPAAAERYRIEPVGGEPIQVVLAFLKPGLGAFGRAGAPAPERP